MRKIHKGLNASKSKVVSPRADVVDLLDNDRIDDKEEEELTVLLYRSEKEVRKPITQRLALHRQTR